MSRESCIKGHIHWLNHPLIELFEFEENLGGLSKGMDLRIKAHQKHRILVALIVIALIALSLVIAYCSYFTINGATPSKKACLLLAINLLW